MAVVMELAFNVCKENAAQPGKLSPWLLTCY